VVQRVHHEEYEEMWYQAACQVFLSPGMHACRCSVMCAQCLSLSAAAVFLYLRSSFCLPLPRKPPCPTHRSEEGRCNNRCAKSGVRWRDSEREKGSSARGEGMW